MKLLLKLHMDVFVGVCVQLIIGICVHKWMSVFVLCHNKMFLSLDLAEKYI
jgi:hypothetical protein